MLLAHLVPFLDAEIDRLQRARDLLAPLSIDSPAIKTLHVVRPLPVEAPSLEASAGMQQQALGLAVAEAPAQAPPKILVLKPHRRGTERMPRRKPAPVTDTALRGAVPAGPVVVSAQAVRQAQESKVTHVGKGVAEPVASLDWRPRASDAPAAEAQLLRKLLDIGSSEDAAHGNASELLLRFMHS